MAVVRLRMLQGDELAFVLTRHWRRLDLALDDADFTDAQAITSIAQITLVIKSRSLCLKQ